MFPPKFFSSPAEKTAKQVARGKTLFLNLLISAAQRNFGSVIIIKLRYYTFLNAGSTWNTESASLNAYSKW